MQSLATRVKFLELYPYLPSYNYMFMLEAMTYKVDTQYYFDLTQLYSGDLLAPLTLPNDSH